MNFQFINPRSVINVQHKEEALNVLDSRTHAIGRPCLNAAVASITADSDMGLGRLRLLGRMLMFS